MFSRRNDDTAEASAKCCAVMGCLAGTAIAGWSWAKFIWPAMSEGGVDFTGRVLLTVFVAGEYSVLGGVAAACGIGALAATAYCCYSACKSDTGRSDENAESAQAIAQLNRIAKLRGSTGAPVVVPPGIQDSILAAPATANASEVVNRVAQSAGQEVRSMQSLMRDLQANKITASQFDEGMRDIQTSLVEKGLTAPLAANQEQAPLQRSEVRLQFS